MLKKLTFVTLMATTAFADTPNNFLVKVSNQMSQGKYHSQSGLKTKTTHMPKLYFEYIGHDVFGFSLSHAMTPGTIRFKDHKDGDLRTALNEQELGLFGKYSGKVWSTITGIRGGRGEVKLNLNQEKESLTKHSLSVFSENDFKVTSSLSLLANGFVSKNTDQVIDTGFDLGTAINISSVTITPMVSYVLNNTRSASLKISSELTKDVSLFVKPSFSKNNMNVSAKGLQFGISSKF